MKPKKLIMSAFCPYSNEVEIDFECFGENGLFLIAGDTGAGKTTIFDGISFALFGEVSGENRGSDTLRSHFAKPETETFVHLVFENKGKTYEIRRNPNYKRPAKRGDSNREVTETSKAELILPGTKVVTGSRQVTQEVIDILGVDHHQFKQIAMIAQGEFLKLLFADSKERGQIFRKVFATGVYEKIQDELKKEMKNTSKQLEETEKIILLEYGNIICDSSEADYNDYVELKKSVYAASKMIFLLDSLIKKKILEKEEQFKKVNSFQEKINDYLKQITSGEELNGLILQLEEEKKKGLIVKNQEDEIFAINKKCHHAKKALYYVKPIMDEWQRLIDEGKTLGQEIDQQTESVKENSALRKSKEGRLTQLKGEERKRQALAFVIQTIKDGLPDYQKLDLKLKRQEEYRGIEKKALNEKIKYEQGIVKDKNRLDTIKENLIVLKDTETKKMQHEQDQKDLEKTKKELVNLNQLVIDCLLIAKKLTKAKHNYQEEEKLFNNKKKNYDKQEMLFYREQAGILAEKLKDNMPCPVCGSRDHPKKAEKSPQAPTQERLNQEKMILEQVQEGFHKASQKCNQLKIELDSKRDQLKKEALECHLEIPENVAMMQETIKAVQKENETSLDDLEKKLHKVKKDIVERKTLEKEQNGLVQKAEVDKKKLEEIKQSLSDYGVYLSGIKAEILGLQEKLKYANKEMATKELAEKEALLKGMIKDLEAAQKTDENLQKKISQAEMLIEEMQKRRVKNLKDLQKSEEKLTKKLKDYNFATKEHYQKALLSEDEIQELEEQVKTHEENKTKVMAAIAQFEKQVDHRKKVDLEALMVKKDQLQQEQAISQTKLGDLEHVIKNNQNISNRLSQREKERIKFDDDLRIVSNLSNTANGELRGKEKLAFEQYVQGVYFDMVLNEANKRLTKMTGSRYYLIRQGQGGNKQSKTGLEIDVKDRWTTQPRSVKSLSGGESFKASMALALGLADVVQNFSGGVELNTVFIDEGFGSLDSESLQQAMEILAELTEGNRLVGIISHLDELKVKIDQKILIKRDPQGSKILLEA